MLNCAPRMSTTAQRAWQTPSPNPIGADGCGDGVSAGSVSQPGDLDLVRSNRHRTSRAAAQAGLSRHQRTGPMLAMGSSVGHRRSLHDAARASRGAGADTWGCLGGRWRRTSAMAQTCCCPSLRALSAARRQRRGRQGRATQWSQATRHVVPAGQRGPGRAGGCAAMRAAQRAWRAARGVCARSPRQLGWSSAHRTVPCVRALLEAPRWDEGWRGRGEHAHARARWRWVRGDEAEARAGRRAGRAGRRRWRGAGRGGARWGTARHGTAAQGKATQTGTG